MAKGLKNFPVRTAGILVIVLIVALSSIYIVINGFPGTQIDKSQTLVYGDYVGGLTTAGIMSSANLWENNNMSVQMNNYTTPNDLATALLKNEVDITTGTPETYAKLNQDGVHFKIVGQEYALLQEIIVKNDSGINTIQESFLTIIS